MFKVFDCAHGRTECHCPAQPKLPSINKHAEKRMYSRAAQPFQWEFFTVTQKLISNPNKVQIRKEKQKRAKANKRTKANGVKMLWGRKGESGKKKKAVSI